MKKLIFLFAFAFIGGQAFSQMYIVSIQEQTLNSCPPNHYTLSTILPTGVLTKTCIDAGTGSYDPNPGLMAINQELNSIIGQGYKLINTGKSDNILNSSGEYLIPGVTFFLAIPWTASGLEEAPTTLKNLFISPNPATDFVDISLDYDLKGESQVVFISEAGYVCHKESIGSISKNEKYNIDISKIPTGKYLVTIVNGKTYTTPQKLIVL